MIAPSIWLLIALLKADLSCCSKRLKMLTVWEVKWRLWLLFAVRHKRHLISYRNVNTVSWDKITHFYHSNEKTKPTVISSPYKYESVYLSYDVNYTFTIAVGDWVFSEDQKIKKYYQVSSHKSGVRMAEQIPATARIWSNFFCLIKPFVPFWLQINERNTLNVRRKEMQAIHITRSKSWLIICTKVYKLEIKI